MRSVLLFGLLCVVGYTLRAQNLLTLTGDTVTINQEKNKVLYVLLDNKSCTGCIDFLGASLKKSNPRIPIVIITTIPNGDLIFKKQYVAAIKRKFPENVQFLTDINNGLLKKYGVKQTPCLLLCEKGLVEYIPYEFIFEDVFVKKAMKKRLKQFVRRTE